MNLWGVAILASTAPEDRPSRGGVEMSTRMSSGCRMSLGMFLLQGSKQSCSLTRLSSKTLAHSLKSGGLVGFCYCPFALGSATGFMGKRLPSHRSPVRNITTA
jgi:hypothetical protein